METAKHRRMKQKEQNERDYLHELVNMVAHHLVRRHT